MVDTSLEQYFNLKANPEKLDNMQLKVYEFIKNTPFCCDKEIAEGLGIEINRVTPRRNELLKMEHITDLGKKKYNNRSVHVWRVK